jgi:hypothetical protein
MKRWLPAIILICVGIGLAWHFLYRSSNLSRPATENPADQTASTPQALLGQTALSSSTNSESPGAGFTGSVNAFSDPAKVSSGLSPATLLDPDPSGLPPATVLENMRTAIRQYGSMFDGNPIGTNLEITQALNGENPKEAKFLKAEAGLRLNQKGELIDSWGTPFFFHQLSGKEMEIRSAGPDRIMWTADDLVIR